LDGVESQNLAWNRPEFGAKPQIRHITPKTWYVTTKTWRPPAPFHPMAPPPAGFQPFPLHNGAKGVILRLFNAVEKRRVTDKHIQKPWRVNA